MKSKGLAIVLALFLGGFGAHKFYLGQTLAGVLYLLFCWTFVPSVIALVEAIIYLTMSEADFNAKYGSAEAKAAAGINAADELGKLHDLLQKGAITQDEYDRRKSQLLA